MDLSNTDAAKVLKKIEAEPDKEEEILKDIENEIALYIEHEEFGISWYEFYDGSLLVEGYKRGWDVDIKPSF